MIKFCIKLIFAVYLPRLALSIYGMNSNNTSVGTNLTSIDYFSPQQPFLNEFKSSDVWMTQDDDTWNTGEENLLDLDENGWVKSLPNDSAGSEYNKVGSLLFRGHSTHLPGKYVVLYEGEGDLEYSLDATIIEELSSPGRDVIEVEPSNEGIGLSITSTDPNKTGDYIRDIKLTPEAHESNINSETFNPEFVDKIEPFSTIRFMDWMETNNSDQKNWSDRPQEEDAVYSNEGVPVEIMVELANETNTDPWFTMPHQATDEYINNFANYVKDNLQPNLDIYVEYSNEVWNSKFDQNQWAKQQAEQEWGGSDLDHLDWYSKRTTEVVEIWDDVFNQDERVVGVMSAQAANTRTGQEVLEYEWSDSALTHSDAGIDAIAIAPYFGRYTGDPVNRNILKNWANDLDSGLDNLFDELTEGGRLNNSPEGGALNEAYENIEAYVQIAQEEDLRLIAYEGGQHLVGLQGLQQDSAISNLFIEANRDPRMGQLYEDYVEEWFEIGGDVFANYSDIRTHNEWGSWGLLESVYDDSSPKYDAIADFI